MMGEPSTTFPVETGLDQYKGWWHGITTGDFNNDGRPDIVAANWGLNSSYKIKHGEPLRLYYDDFNGDRRVDIIEAHADGEGNYVPMKRLYHYNSLPIISNQVQSYEQFASSTLEDIFGNQLSRIPYKEINTLQHTLFINTGSSFEAHPLPVEAQVSAGFHTGVADFNNDGNEDLFMSQNYFGLPRQVPRLDAGRGLILHGDGQGNFRAVSGSSSGIKIYGEQRGAATSDFNQDGKTDLVVSQNNAATTLFLNQTSEVGYSVTLEGPPSNGNGVGSAVQLVYENGQQGPLREIQAGSGYWSQNSFTQVLGSKAGNEVTGIEIHWFDGRSQTVEVEEGQRTYEVEFPG
ncbi:MAG: CRTAC1 family protein [Balneolaceae bacterium]|nr:CRTAC1 family protein [Balneolaceae bacterium]